MSSGMEKLESFLANPAVTEIMINGNRGTFLEINGKKETAPVKFSEEDVRDIVDKLFDQAGKPVSERRPYADACLPDGSRANVILAPLARCGTTVTIRKFLSELNDIDDLIKRGTLDRRMADFLLATIRGKLNILFAGGTGAGKTTTLEMLSRAIPEDERIITIEDTAELKLHHKNLVPLETRGADENDAGEVSLRDLIRNALRMRPDRLIIGEVRGSEALDLVQAMTTGHRGTLGVIHGSSPREVVGRMETLILSSGIRLPLDDIRKMLAQSLDLIIQQERFPDGIRRITHITEIRGLSGRELELHDLFAFQIDGIKPDGAIVGQFRPVIKTYPKCYSDFVKHGLLSEGIFS